MGSLAAFVVRFRCFSTSTWRDRPKRDSPAAPRVAPDDWIAALCSEFDPIGVHDLKANVRHTKEVRDKIHQDRIGARADIDWHDFGYDKAFIPARDALQPLLRQFEDQVPKTTNLLI